MNNAYALTHSLLWFRVNVVLAMYNLFRVVSLKGTINNFHNQVPHVNLQCFFK
jgi:hypothetical protein